MINFVKSFFSAEVQSSESDIVLQHQNVHDIQKVTSKKTEAVIQKVVKKSSLIKKELKDMPTTFSHYSKKGEIFPHNELLVMLEALQPLQNQTDFFSLTELHSLLLDLETSNDKMKMDIAGLKQFTVKAHQTIKALEQLTQSQCETYLQYSKMSSTLKEF